MPTSDAIGRENADLCLHVIATRWLLAMATKPLSPMMTSVIVSQSL